MSAALAIDINESYTSPSGDVSDSLFILDEHSPSPSPAPIISFDPPELEFSNDQTEGKTGTIIPFEPSAVHSDDDIIAFDPSEVHFSNSGSSAENTLIVPFKSPAKNPFKGDFRNVQNGFNLYAYARNNPLGFIDPMGLSANKIQSTIFNVFDKLLKPVSAALNVVDHLVGEAFDSFGSLSSVFGTFHDTISPISTAIKAIDGMVGANFSGLSLHNLTSKIGKGVKQTLSLPFEIVGGIATGVDQYIGGEIGGVYNVSIDEFGVLKVSPNLEGKLGKGAMELAKRVFINGILNNINEAAKLALIHGNTESSNDPVLLIHNPTKGIWADLTESGLGLLFGQSSVSRGAEQILAFGAENNTDTRLILHSQGGIIGGNAISSLSQEFPGQWSNLQVETHGSAANNIIIGENTEKLGGTFSQGSNTHDLDFVGTIGLNNINPIKIATSALFIPTLFSGRESLDSTGVVIVYFI